MRKESFKEFFLIILQNCVNAEFDTTEILMTSNEFMYIYIYIYRGTLRSARSPYVM